MTNLEVKDFRIELKPFTVLTGVNDSGKSEVCEAITDRMGSKCIYIRASSANKYDSLASKLDEIKSNSEIETIIIQNPDAFLYPAVQSKLADLFTKYIKETNTQIVIETHSEYLIRKLQYLVASGSFDSGDVIIHYFGVRKDDSESVNLTDQERRKEIKILENGDISEKFGTGFFDEATNIIMKSMSIG